MTALITIGALVTIGLGVFLLFMAPYSQIFGRYPFRGRTAQPLVALTFDDGPNEPYTSAILDYLDTVKVRATFFHVGQCAQRHPETVKRIAASGHVIGNHSLSHRFSTYLRPNGFEREVTQTQAILRDLIGHTPALARTPWLWRQPALLHMLRRNGLRPVAGAFCHALEVFQPDGQRMARRAVAKTRPGTILIFHDGFDARGGDRSQTVHAVRFTTEALLAKGFRFVTVDELLDIPAYA